MSKDTLAKLEEVLQLSKLGGLIKREEIIKEKKNKALIIISIILAIVATAVSVFAIYKLFFEEADDFDYYDDFEDEDYDYEDDYVVLGDTKEEEKTE